jgi:pyruvate-ferredoxin/flavodoxin oxidoreductase
MTKPTQATIDGNEAAAYVAFKTSEVIAIYPITPSSPMGELADSWSARGDKNLWGMVPTVRQMQAESGAAGAIHGALQGGSLATTFTASQGLLLMIPAMYKIAGELNSTVFHVASRTVATHALSIFGDHSDVMAARATGWGMLFAGSVQEAMDFALISQAATLEARVPFIHIFDGFRTSHEVMKVEALSDDDIRALIDDRLVRAHRARALTPDKPIIRGTAQNPDVFFQSREAANPYYLATPDIVERAMDSLADRVGRRYKLFEYVGSPDAERVIVAMGSACETIHETVDHLVSQGEKIGLVKVRLFRPFSVRHLLEALPSTVRSVAVLDRTKEPGSVGEPLYLDVVSALVEGVSSGEAPFAAVPRVIGGRYGLSSKEFTPAMVKAVFDEMASARPANHFTVGIVDDVTHTSLSYDPSFSIEPDEVVRAVFWGLGADGTVSANKNSIKIIGEMTDLHAQGYFVYDSKKSGGNTISHLRFGPKPIRSTYLIERANFVAIHQFGFLSRYDVLGSAEPGAALLLNSPHGPDTVWDHLPGQIQRQIVEKRLRLYVIDALKVARETGMGGRINTIMQPCFFSITSVLPLETAMTGIKDAIHHSYGKKGADVLRNNLAAVDSALDNLHEVKVPAYSNGAGELKDPVPAEAPAFVRKVTAKMIAGQGDRIPVSALPPDGTYPSGTARWEKRGINVEAPVWDVDLCIQCGKCVMVCPHSAIRAKIVDQVALEGSPQDFKHAAARWRELDEKRYTLQVAANDCTGCTLCVEACPVDDKEVIGRKAVNMQGIGPIREKKEADWDFFLGLPNAEERDTLAPSNVKNVQLLEPLFEFSGACAGCGETPYLQLLTQLYGDRSLVANATGCSSIFGGNLPTTPWTHNEDGRGPAWSNSLFEDNAEFGLGMRLALDRQAAYARDLVRRLSPQIGLDLADRLLLSEQNDQKAIDEQRVRVVELRACLEGLPGPDAKDLRGLADTLVSKSVWIVGGDGWAYDIGFGGLDHVLAGSDDVNVLVLDTEVYSNTGGQASKATPLGAVAKYAAAGKSSPRKDLGLMVMTYGHVYVAQVAMGANDTQTLKAIREAEAYPGPSLIIAYSQCIEHGIVMAQGMEHQKMAVESGHWPLYRYDPRLRGTGKSPFQLDSKATKISLEEFASTENRYKLLQRADPEAAKRFISQAQEIIDARLERYKRIAEQG